ncbi:MAG: hypothetical protein H0X39_08895 [Actinobacteria bacterium]|nr:hypothetical protein [Actinomycetota bacterium]
MQTTGAVRETYRTASEPGAPGLHHYEYVFPDRRIDVYDIDHSHRLVARWVVPAAHALRGVAASPRTHRLYLSVGGNGGTRGDGSVIAYDLITNHIVWERAFPTGTDGLAVTPDGTTLFVPVGEHTTDTTWWIVSAAHGRVTGAIHAGPGPHNTIVAPDGRHVYLGPRNSRFLFVASTSGAHALRRIGPLLPGVRPFTIDGRQRFAYTTATGFLGFQVSSIATGRLLFTVRAPGARRGRPLGTPSHGISLTPDSREVDVIDVPNGAVHAYDVSRVPAEPPRLLATIRLAHPLIGSESPCGGDCGRAGWLQASLDGRYLYVGDSGDVLDVRRRRVTAFLPALHNSRYLLELDWRGRTPIRTSTRSGVGRVDG